MSRGFSTIAPRTPKGVLVWAIVLGTLLRVVAAAAMGLGIDESYEVANARVFQLSFFDHAPVSFWMATLAMKVLGTDAAFAVRLPFVLLFVVTTLLMYGLTARLFGAWAGAWAAVLFNVSPLFSIVAGSWVMPDGPMLLAVLASAYCLAPVLVPGDGQGGAPPDAWRAWRAWCAWIMAGFWIGAAMLSKYLAVLYVLGLGLYVVSTPGCRRWLLHPAPYLGAVLALLVFSPVLIWNAQHEWVSFVFQGSRARGGGGLRPLHVLVSLGGQAIYLLPWIWWPLLNEGIKSVRAGSGAAATWFCACLGLPAIVLMTIIPLWGKPGLPHWTAVGYVFLVPVLGLAVASQIDGAKRRLIRGWLGFSIVSYSVIMIVLVGHAATGWGRAVLPEGIADEDPTMDMLSWRPVESLLTEHGLDEVAIAAVHWIDGAKAGHALGARRPVTVFSQNPHNFPFLDAPESFTGRDIVFVGPPEHLESLEVTFADYFTGFQRLGRVQLERLAGPEQEIEVVLGRRMLKPYEWPY